MALFAVPLEPFPGVGTEVSPKVLFGEFRADQVDLADGDAGQKPHEERFLRIVGGGPPDDRRVREPGEVPGDRTRNGKFAADLDEEWHDTPTGREGAVEVERGDGRTGVSAHVTSPVGGVVTPPAPVRTPPATDAPPRPAPAVKRRAPSRVSPDSITARPS